VRARHWLAPSVKSSTEGAAMMRGPDNVHRAWGGTTENGEAWLAKKHLIVGAQFPLFPYSINIV
jgi:hypothetical protein